MKTPSISQAIEAAAIGSKLEMNLTEEFTLLNGVQYEGIVHEYDLEDFGFTLVKEEVVKGDDHANKWQDWEKK